MQLYLRHFVCTIQLYVFTFWSCEPRNCIGIRFALLEVNIALIKILSTFRFIKSKKTKIPLRLFTKFEHLLYLHHILIYMCICVSFFYLSVYFIRRMRNTRCISLRKCQNVSKLKRKKTNNCKKTKRKMKIKNRINIVF